MCNTNVIPVSLAIAVILVPQLMVSVTGTGKRLSFNNSPEDAKVRSTKLPPCKACSTLVNSFNKAMDITSRGKHAGGDAAWEEEKLRSYKTSEVRLVEIQELLCTDVKRGEDQCHSLSNDHEYLLEDWFLHKQAENSDLHQWLCIEELKVCCPPDHYGPECKRCPNCNGNGICKGNGTRKGNGKCACDAGYTDDNCDQCAHGYYEAFRDGGKLLCSVCHAACDGGCSGAGPTACHKCKKGWRTIAEAGCGDINECLETSNICRSNQFCVNNEGSYACLECDRSCNGCDGDGPDMCKTCADGYKLKEGKCQVELTSITEQNASSIETETEGENKEGTSVNTAKSDQTTVNTKREEL